MKKIIYIISIVACTISSTSGFGQNTSFLHKLEDKRTDAKTSFYTFITGTAKPISLATPLTFWITGMINKKTTLKKYALFTLESFAFSQGFSFAIKTIGNKPRPVEHDPTLHPLKTSTNASFPSGHTSVAFATATSLSIISHKWYVIVPAFTWASLIGYSRLYLGVHYPADVIGGAFIGSASALLSYKLNKWMHAPKKQKIKKIPNS